MPHFKACGLIHKYVAPIKGCKASGSSERPRVENYYSSYLNLIRGDPRSKTEQNSKMSDDSTLGFMKGLEHTWVRLRGGFREDRG